ncbi:MAG: energy-coupling factor transporter transmembrane protein EcfT [Desulfobacterales bacterium]
MTAFGYRPGGSFLHRLDPRTKLIALTLLGLIGLGAPAPWVAAAGLLTSYLLWRAGVGPLGWMRDLRVLWLLLLFVLMARGLSGGGSPLVEIGPVCLSAEGLAEGVSVCLRLWLVALAGIGVSATTSPSGIEAAVRMLLAPVPFFPEKQAATMLGLVVRFLPEVLKEAQLTREAQKARGIESRKNPVARLSLFAVSLLRRIFARADRMALAMEARCYSHNRTKPEWAPGIRDALAVGLLGLFSVLSFL